MCLPLAREAGTDFGNRANSATSFTYPPRSMCDEAIHFEIYREVQKKKKNISVKEKFCKVSVMAAFLLGLI